MAITDFPGNSLLTCDWLPINNVLFQVANSWLCILYIGDFIPFPSHLSYMVFLRIVLACTALFFSAWGAWVLCSPDTAVWNLIFLLYNMCQLSYLLYKEYNPTVVKPRFERLFNRCYKGSGIPIERYNALVEAGTVLTVAGDQLLHKHYYLPDKLVQIISGKIIIYLTNGKIVKLREGDFINHDNWNFNINTPRNVALVERYVVPTETTLISWSYARLTESLHGTERRLFSYLLMSHLNTLLLKLNNIILDQGGVMLDLTGSLSDSPASESWGDQGRREMEAPSEESVELNGRIGEEELVRLVEAESGV